MCVRWVGLGQMPFRQAVIAEQQMIKRFGQGRTNAARERADVIGGIEERLYYCIELNTDVLKPQNVITAAVHQCNGKSSDLVFDLSVEGLLEPDEVE